MDYILTDLVKEAKDIFKRENGRLKLTFVDKTVIRFEPEVGAFIVAFDPKRPPKIKTATAKDLAAELAHMGLS